MSREQVNVEWNGLARFIIRLFPAHLFICSLSLFPFPWFPASKPLYLVASAKFF